MPQSVQNILLSILGGILTVAFVGLARRAWRRYWRWRFKNVFGSAAEGYSLVYTRFVLRPEFQRHELQIPAELLQFPLAKQPDSRIRISAEKSASACEIRAASFVGPTIAKELGVAVHFVDDSSLRERLDVDFVSFGASANDKSVDIFRNDANDLVEYDPSVGFFVWKKSRRPIYRPRQDGLHDYGIILKIHPSQFPRRTWIACAGIGETGTSASAYFLATKWRQIEKVVGRSGRFVCLVRAEIGKDESAVLFRGPFSHQLLESEEVALAGRPLDGEGQRDRAVSESNGPATTNLSPPY